MKKMTSFLLTLLFFWNIIITVQYYLLTTQKENQVTYTPSSTIQQASVEISSDVTELVKKSENKVVTVTSSLHGQSVGTGSGAIYRIDDDTVYIITNYHVISDGNEASIIFANQKESEAEIVGKDQLTDLALLKTTIDFEVEAFTIGDSSLTQKGEYVIAMGSPLGIEYQGSVSGGLISGLNRRMEMDIDDDGISDWDMNVLQTDAAINPGNSGGPLINQAGELIGINSMKIADTTVEGFGFAIPINEVIPIITQLEKEGKVIRPILGVSVQSIHQFSNFEKSYYGLENEEGLFVVNVSQGSPAQKAGIQTGDLLVSIDGVTLTDFKQFRQILYSHKVNDKIHIIYKRDGKKLEKEITLA